MRREGIRELHLNPARGWSDTGIDFLREVPWLDGLKILDLTIEDISVIHTLPRLRDLSIETYCLTPLDFSCWPELQSCVLYWRAGSESLFDARSLKTLFIHRYDGKSLSSLKALSGLISLEVANSAVSDIQDLGAFERLTTLGLYNLRALRSLDGLEQLLQLERLFVTGCGRLGNVAQLSNATRLETLHLNDAGHIASLDPLASLPNLREVLFYGTTYIDDGNLDMLLRLPSLQKVSFQNRRHYSLTREAIGVAIAPSANSVDHP